MRIMNTRVVALLASLACCLAAPALAASDPVPIMPVTKARLAVPDVETSGHALTAVHFWATWCVPCVSELPELDAAAATYKDIDFQVVAISLDIDMVKVKLFFDEKGIRTLAPLLDKNSAAFLTAKLRGLPGTLFFNKEGELIARADGPVDWKSAATITFIESPY